jgi:hypothetical protein
MSSLYDRLNTIRPNALMGGQRDVDLRRVTPQNALTLGSSLPFVGDAIGLAGDAYGYATNPSTRTWPNALLTAASMIPAIPAGLGKWADRASDAQRKVLDELDDDAVSGAVSNFEDLDMMRPQESLNTAASSAFFDYDISPKSYDIPIDRLKFTGDYSDKKSIARIRELAEEIRANGKIEPLFVGLHGGGELSVMEGQHRLRALQALGYKTVPAKVVVGVK